MAYQGIGTGTTPNDNSGDSLLVGALKVNSNFEEIYTALGDGSTLSFTEKVQDAIGFVAGTVMLFQQTSAPTGWTKITTHNDKTLRVVSGTAGSGGSTAFTSVFASRSVTGTVGNTTLTTAQMPSHNHTVAYKQGVYSGGGHVGTQTWNGEVSTTTGSTGGGGSHNHSFSGTALDFDVQYVDVIFASKD